MPGKLTRTLCKALVHVGLRYSLTLAWLAVGAVGAGSLPAGGARNLSSRTLLPYGWGRSSRGAAYGARARSCFFCSLKYVYQDM